MPGMDRVAEAARLDGREDRPLVLRGFARGWPALAWTPAGLAARFGALRLPVAALDRARLATDGRRGLVLGEMALADFVAGLEGGATGYLMAPLTALPPALRDELAEPPPARDAPFRSGKLWCSPAGAVSPLHFDLPHNLHVQLHGRKRFLLFSPRDSRALYPHGLASSTPNFAAVDPERPDLARHPRFSRARPLACTLEPGDALFIPARHWHHVRSESTSLSVNFWWARGAVALVARAGDLWKRARGISR